MSSGYGIPRHVAIVDVETTGFDPKTDRIISVAVAKVDMQKVAKDLFEKGSFWDDAGVLVEVVNPKKRIPSAASKVNGFTNQSVRGKPEFKEKAQEIRDYIGDLPVVGHNVSFDKQFLNAELKRAGAKTLHRTKSYCTMNWYVNAHNGGRRKGSNLDDAAYRVLGSGRKGGTHDAVEDVNLCMGIAARWYAEENKMKKSRLKTKRRSSKRRDEASEKVDDFKTKVFAFLFVLALVWWLLF